MTDEFLTKGLQNDRHLKAIQLVHQFETEIVHELRRYGDRMVAENPKLFEPDVEGRKNTGSSSSALWYARLDYRMSRVQAPDDESTQKLNIHLYWVRPEQYNRSDIDGTLCGFGYKVKNSDSEAEEHIAVQTRDWDLHTAEDPFGSRTVFYGHVDSAEDIRQIGENLVEHFSAFGSEFGVPKT